MWVILFEIKGFFSRPLELKWHLFLHKGTANFCKLVFQSFLLSELTGREVLQRIPCRYGDSGRTLNFLWSIGRFFFNSGDSWTSVCRQVIEDSPEKIKQKIRESYRSVSVLFHLLLREEPGYSPPLFPPCLVTLNWQRAYFLRNQVFIQPSLNGSIFIVPVSLWELSSWKWPRASGLPTVVQKVCK